MKFRFTPAQEHAINRVRDEWMTAYQLDTWVQSLEYLARAGCIEVRPAPNPTGRKLRPSEAKEYRKRNIKNVFS